MMAMFFMCCFCTLLVLVAMFHGLIGNLIVVLLLITLGASIKFAVMHYKNQCNNILNYLCNAFFVIPVFVGVNAEDDLLSYLFGVLSIWSLIFIIMYFLFFSFRKLLSK